MKSDLLDETTRELLAKFGQGEAKPGSGSAAALGGLISAHLIVTVIKISLKPEKRGQFKEHISKLEQYEKEITNKIIPRLEDYFQRDSNEFKTVVDLRNQRIRETDSQKKCQIETEHIAAMKTVTELPIQIGNLCVQLAPMADFVFKNAFQAVRGDSGAALNKALSTLTSCILIADLNMTYIPFDDWKRKTRKDLDYLCLQKSKIQLLSQECYARLQSEALGIEKLQQEFAQLVIDSKQRTFRTETDIESLAEKVHEIANTHSKVIWGMKDPETQMELIDPQRILRKACGYQVRSLGESDAKANPKFITAGIIDQSKRMVLLYNGVDSNVQNFTAAHELGHALMHNQTVLHRDRPIDGTKMDKLNPIEYQANRFAGYYLMPSDLVREAFKNIFGTSVVKFDENAAKGIFNRELSEMRKSIKDRRAYSREVAGLDFVRGKSVQSISRFFNVSIETMAIRLEELGLVEY
jgi:Zn-dependent peptidase ImmA (M78 family)/formiminotetrahydrofolate cyclodeaminase